LNRRPADYEFACGLYLIGFLFGGSAFVSPPRPSTANFEHDVAHNLKGGAGISPVL
jgi:hypothetical protein